VLEETITRLKFSQERVQKFIDRNIMEWADQEILQPARDDMLKAGLSQQAANGLNLDKTGFMKVSLVWEYIKDGKPIHFYIEYDTRPHWIYPKGKLHAGADMLSWMGKNGVRVFARRVYHTGTTGKMLCHNAAKQYTPFLKQRIITETNAYLAVNQL